MEFDLTLSMQEKSNYFRGMLVLMKMDRKIDNAEKALLTKIGKTLGFEASFCRTAIKELLENDYLSEEIPVFSSKDITKCFVKDGLRLAISDHELNPSELDYLKKTIDTNGLTEKWFRSEIKKIIIKDDYNNLENELFIEKHIEQENYSNI
jgi:uncharacterized tellurite resistance protein B-like protein